MSETPVKFEARIGPCSQGRFVNVSVQRCDAYERGAEVQIDNGDCEEGVMFVYMSTDDLRNLAADLIAAADAVEASRASEGDA